MPIYDATEDPRVDMMIASNIGAGIGNMIAASNKRKLLEQEKEKKRLQKAYTIRGLKSDLQDMDLLEYFNNMPGAIENDLVQSLNRKAIEKRIFNPTTLSQDFQDFNRLVQDRQKLYKWDGVQQQFVVTPGGEELLKGYDTGIRNVLERINKSLPADERIPSGQTYEQYPQRPEEEIVEEAEVTEEAEARAPESLTEQMAAGAAAGAVSPTSIKRTAKGAMDILRERGVQIGDNPTPEELRRQNTREAYEKGRRLGYWK